MSKNINTFQKDFDGWNQLAKELDQKQCHLFDVNTKKYIFRTREIWFCSVGVNIGTEICGKNLEFERPILVINRSHRTFVCLPLTSKKPKFEHLYVDISYIDNSGVLVESYVLTSNPISYDVNRLQRKIRKLSSHNFNKILSQVQSNFNLPKNDLPT
jgi:mRNA interferase MazF